MRSTSIHNLNADKGLNILEKPLYLLLNFINNLFPYSNLDKRIVFKSFGDFNWEKEWDKTYQTSSVGRRLSDLFWRTLPWAKIKAELGEIHIFDTGCGSGNYGVRINDASGGIATYTGVDAKEKSNWALLRKKYPNFRFIESRSTNIRSLIPPDTNLFITQSAIEHFGEDLLFFEQISEYIEKSLRPVIQVHIFPAARALPLYLFHGVRQYTPRTISQITRMFDASNFTLFGLGGKAGGRVHWKYFTWPMLVLRQKARWSDDPVSYEKAVRKAIESDCLRPNRPPLFWALIIHSHSKNEIW